MRNVQNKYRTTLENKNNKADNNKKYLIEKMKNNTKLIKNETPQKREVINNEDLLKYKELYKKTKKQLEDEQIKNKEMLKIKTAYLNDKVKTLQIEIQRLHEINFNLSSEINNKNNEINTLLKDIKMSDSVQSALDAERVRVFDLKETISKLTIQSSEAFSFLQDYTNLQVSNEHLTKRKTEISILHDSLKRDVKRLEDIIITKDNEIDYLKKTITKINDKNYSELLDKLNDDINAENWREFEGGFVLLRQLHYFKNREIYEESEHVEKVFGYINKEENTLTSIDGDIYAINKSTYKSNIENESPCSANVFYNKGNIAHILHVYDSIDDFKYMIEIERKVKRKIRKKRKVYPKLGEERISFVTSVNGKHCKDKIGKYGFDTRWINPFETGNQIVSSLVSTSDIVVCYPDYMSHGVLDKLEKEKDNIIYTNTFNETLLINIIMSKVKQLRKKRNRN